MGALPWEQFERRPPGGLWARLIGYDGRKEGSDDGVYEGAPSFDLTFGAVQVGLDLRREEGSNGERDQAGVYAAFGHAKGDVEHDYLTLGEVDAGDVEMSAASLGGYWTRTGREGWYVDGVLQGTFYDVDMEARRGVGETDTDGWGLAASLEGGYPFPLRDGWLVEPQGQLVYQYLDFDAFEDRAARVAYDDLDSLAGRLGARLARTWDAAGPGEAPQPAAIWGRFNIWQEFLSNPTTTFSGFGRSVPFTSDLDDTWAEFEIGADMKQNESVSFYGDISYQVTFDGEADSFGAEAGLRWHW
jgi:outer membrane autotransporter protein